MRDRDNLLNKLTQIEEQVNYTLTESPLALTKARLKMILALTRYLRTEIALWRSSSALLAAPERHASENDDSDLRSSDVR
ncbi:MAG TPA: hypothetical protein VEU32_08715 [Burkholderiales bacterium]|nr:hypothetical protein [Burkholderiales bacterium]